MRLVPLCGITAYRNLFGAPSVQAEPTMPLDEAHNLSGRVEEAIQKGVPQVQSVLVHMEPFES